MDQSPRPETELERLEREARELKAKLSAARKQAWKDKRPVEQDRLASQAKRKRESEAKQITEEAEDLVIPFESTPVESGAGLAVEQFQVIEIEAIRNYNSDLFTAIDRLGIQLDKIGRIIGITNVHRLYLAARNSPLAAKKDGLGVKRYAQIAAIGRVAEIQLERIAKGHVSRGEPVPTWITDRLEGFKGPFYRALYRTGLAKNVYSELDQFKIHYREAIEEYSKTLKFVFKRDWD